MYLTSSRTAVDSSSRWQSWFALVVRSSCHFIQELSGAAGFLSLRPATPALPEFCSCRRSLRRSGLSAAPWPQGEGDRPPDSGVCWSLSPPEEAVLPAALSFS